MNLIEAMRAVLGTSFSLYLMTHGAHWNVEGRDFYQLHKMLEDQYTEMWEANDKIAESIRTLDAYAPASMARFLELSRVEELGMSPIDADAMLVHLMASHEIIVDLMTEALHIADEMNEQGIVNLLGDRIEAHQKHRWMLRSTAKNI
jgi:starvation-inducible DNA-binding protein